MTTDNSELLKRYLAERSEGAFTLLVERNIDLVCSAAATRVTRGARPAWQALPEVQATFAQLLNFVLKENSDGSFSLDDIPSGDYTFVATVAEPGDTPDTLTVHASARVPVKVPPGATAGKFDLGEVELQPVRVYGDVVRNGGICRKREKEAGNQALALRNNRFPCPDSPVHVRIDSSKKQLSQVPDVQGLELRKPAFRTKSP